MSAAIRFWGARGLLLASLLGAVQVASQPGPPRGPEVAGFSEARARDVLARLVAVGPRVVGTEPWRAAADQLEAELAAIEGVEVARQRHRGVHARGALTWQFEVDNVLGRIRGQRPEAVLLSAHFDTAPGSPGAADDGAAVAALIEVLRGLSSGAALPYTVVVALNGSEEELSLGAVALREHPWFADVRAVVNLDAAGAGGRLMLLRAPTDQRLLRAYASVPRPWAVPLAHDLLRSGLLPFHTDHDVLVEGGPPGLDLALVTDGFAYHSALDRPERLQPGTLQHVGDTVAALVQGLGAEPLDGPAQPAGAAVALDLLGMGVIWAPARWASALLLGAVALLVASWRAIPGAGWPRGALAVTIALGASVGGAVLIGVSLSALGRGSAWAAAPVEGALASGGAAVAIALATLWAAARRIPHAPAAIGGAVALGWAALGLLLLAAGAASAWLAALWAAATAAALIGQALRPHALWDWLWAIPALGTLHAAHPLLQVLVPMAGWSPVGAAADGLLAAVWAGLAVTIALAAAPGAASAGELRRGAALAAAIAAVGVGALCLGPRWSLQHPRRVWLRQDLGEAGQGPVIPSAGDGLPLALAPVPAASALAPAEVSGTRQPGEGAHRVTLTVAPGPATAMELIVEGGLEAWSLGPAPEGIARAYAIGLGRSGWEIELIVRDEASVTLIEYVAGEWTPGAAQLADALPADHVAQSLVVRTRSVDWRAFPRLEAP